MFESGLELARRAFDASATSGVQGDLRRAARPLGRHARRARAGQRGGTARAPDHRSRRLLIATEVALVQTQIMSGRLREGTARARRDARDGRCSSPGQHPADRLRHAHVAPRDARPAADRDRGILPAPERNLDRVFERARALGEIETPRLGTRDALVLRRASMPTLTAHARMRRTRCGIAERTGSAFSQMSAYGTLALAHRLVGSWREARASFCARAGHHPHARQLPALGGGDARAPRRDRGHARRARRGHRPRTSRARLGIARVVRFVELIATVTLVRALLGD